MSQTTIGSVSLGLDPAPLPLEALYGSREEKTPQEAPPDLDRRPPRPRSSPARHLGLRGAGAPFPRSQARSSEPRRAPGMPKHDAEAQPSPGNTQPRAVLHPRGGPWPSQGSEESV
ncbi:unnamed protein product [Rangifer tarandus platyrhynchus]|uniref:Uncharacterized protein n=1 Tax=Rangifer tarandus platyrhynchus TaxID=3082113 RepID=A0ABN8ZTQ2_RANTA|nr:unnamed protein product [Rangifer tarandus platyrhynchus]